MTCLSYLWGRSCSEEPWGMFCTELQHRVLAMKHWMVESEISCFWETDKCGHGDRHLRVWVFVNSTDVYIAFVTILLKVGMLSYKVDNFVGNGWGHSDTHLQPNGCKKFILLHVRCLMLSQHGQFRHRKVYVLKSEVLWACGCHGPFPDLFIIWVLAAAVFGLSYYCSQHDWFFSGYFSEPFQKLSKIMPHGWDIWKWLEVLFTNHLQYYNGILDYR